VHVILSLTYLDPDGVALRLHPEIIQSKSNLIQRMKILNQPPMLKELQMNVWRLFV
jgi:hypothetical protein